MVTATSTESTEDSTALAFIMLAEPKQHTGHAPPIDSFTGEKTEVLLDYWLRWTEGNAHYSLQGTFVGRHYKNGV